MTVRSRFEGSYTTMARFAEDRRTLLLPAIHAYSIGHEPLPGVNTVVRREAFIGQVVESIRRIEFVKRMATRSIDPQRADPANAMFDPLKAALIHRRSGNLDEAIWLVFLATHFGKHLRDGWRLVRDIYRGDGRQPWTFTRLTNNPGAFDKWIQAAYEGLKGDGVGRRFGNHRKYETLRPDSERGTSRVLASYVAWVGPNRGHAGMLADAVLESGPDPKALFDSLYQSMEAVTSFGRTARFDFLTMIGKLGLANIEPGIPYLVGATGPLSGARLMFSGDKAAKLKADDLDARTALLGAFLELGMQEMEDSLCNWQKSPDAFVPFRG